MVRAERVDPVHDRVERVDPRRTPIAHVPDEAELPPRRQHAVEFGERAIAVEPVERLRHGDRVRRAIPQRHVLGGAVEGDRERDSLGQLLAHLGERLDRDHGRARSSEHPGQLAGAGADVDDDPPPCDAELPHEDVHGGLGIVGPDPLV